ncbi:hypothetical protein WJX84_011816 [Apatococcus fuscideae]|uniref:Uncharacterized protein n=1 Tax=Apatococcus fuscideae TaxID=2026836 RepID=A0AAW1SMF3_9CHLO
MQRISEEPSSILDKGPDPESVLEAACCSELAAQLGELASFVKKASNVFLKLNEQESQLRTRILAAQARAAKLKKEFRAPPDTSEDLLAYISAMLEPPSHAAAPQEAGLELQAHMDAALTSINEDLGASEAQHREIHRLMSFSTRLADLAGSRPSQLQNAWPSDMGIIAEAAEAGTSAEVQGAPEAVDAAIELEASPEASEGSTSTQLAALERELELEESASGFSTASLPQPSGLDQPVAASGSQLPTTADATATEAGPVEATTWPLAAVLAPSRWRALVRRRAPDVPATAAPSASGPAAEIESSATTSADETNLALAETSMASAEASDAIFFQASAAREAGIGSERDMPAADLPSGDAETHGTIAVDLADGSASEDPETWLMGGSSFGDAASTQDMMSAPTSPRIAASRNDHDMMQFSPSPQPGQPKATTNVATPLRLVADGTALRGVAPGFAKDMPQHTGGQPGILSEDPIASVKQQVAILDGQVPLTGQHHGKRQRSPERAAIPSSVLVIADASQDEMLVGAHHAQRQGSPRKASRPDTQLVIEDESQQEVLVGAHHSHRQAMSPERAAMPSSVLVISDGSLDEALVGAHDAQRQRSPPKVARAATQLVIDGKVQQEVLLGAHHSQRQPASPAKASQLSADDYKAIAQETVLTGTHHAERQPLSLKTAAQAITAETSPADAAEPANEIVEDADTSPLASATMDEMHSPMDTSGSEPQSAEAPQLAGATAVPATAEGKPPNVARRRSRLLRTMDDLLADTPRRSQPSVNHAAAHDPLSISPPSKARPGGFIMLAPSPFQQARSHVHASDDDIGSGSSLEPAQQQPAAALIGTADEPSQDAMALHGRIRNGLQAGGNGVDAELAALLDGIESPMPPSGNTNLAAANPQLRQAGWADDTVHGSAVNSIAAAAAPDQTSVQSFHGARTPEDVSTEPLLEVSGVPAKVAGPVRRPVAEATEHPSKSQQPRAPTHSQTMQPQALAAWFPRASRTPDPNHNPIVSSTSSMPAEAPESQAPAGKLPGWLGPKLSRATSLLKGSSPTAKASLPSRSPNLEIQEGMPSQDAAAVALALASGGLGEPLAQRPGLHQSTTVKQTQGNATRPAQQPHRPPMQLASWRGPLIQARHAAPVAPPLPPGSPTKQQESAASFAALLEGLANFGSDPAAGLLMLNNKEHHPAVQTAATPGLDAKASRRSEKVDILAERFGRKHGAEAFLPGSEGVVLDVRTMRLEPNFSPFAAGIRESQAAQMRPPAERAAMQSQQVPSANNAMQASPAARLVSPGYESSVQSATTPLWQPEPSGTPAPAYSNPGAPSPNPSLSRRPLAQQAPSRLQPVGAAQPPFPPENYPDGYAGPQAKQATSQLHPGNVQASTQTLPAAGSCPPKAESLDSMARIQGCGSLQGDGHSLAEATGSKVLMGDNHKAPQKDPPPSSARGSQPDGNGPADSQSRGHHGPQPSYTYSPLMAQAPTEPLLVPPNKLVPVPEASEVPFGEHTIATAASVSQSAASGRDSADHLGQILTSAALPSRHAPQPSMTYAPLGKARHERTPSWTHSPLETQASSSSLSSSTGEINPRTAQGIHSQHQGPLTHQMATFPSTDASLAREAPASADSSPYGAEHAKSWVNSPAAMIHVTATTATSGQQHQPEPERMIRHSHAPSSVYGPLGKAVRSSQILAEGSPRLHFDAAILGSLEDPLPRRQAPSQPEPGLPAPMGPHIPLKGSDGSLALAASKHGAYAITPGTKSGGDEPYQAGGSDAKHAQRQSGQVAQMQQSQGAIQPAGASSGAATAPPEAWQVTQEHWRHGSVMSNAMLSPLQLGAAQHSASQSLQPGLAGAVRKATEPPAIAKPTQPAPASAVRAAEVSAHSRLVSGLPPSQPAETSRASGLPMHLSSHIQEGLQDHPQEAVQAARLPANPPQHAENVPQDQYIPQMEHVPKMGTRPQAAAAFAPTGATGSGVLPAAQQHGTTQPGSQPAHAPGLTTTALQPHVHTKATIVMSDPQPDLLASNGPAGGQDGISAIRVGRIGSQTHAFSPAEGPAAVAPAASAAAAGVLQQLIQPESPKQDVLIQPMPERGHNEENESPVDSPEQSIQLTSQANWSHLPGASSFRTPFDAHPHHSFGNPFNDPGLASERGTIKSTYTSDTMRTNMTVDTLPSIPRAHPRQRPKLESHLADLRYLAAHQRNDTQAEDLPETELCNAEPVSQGGAVQPAATSRVSLVLGDPVRRRASESHRYGLDVSMDAGPWGANAAQGHAMRPDEETVMQSPHSPAESLEAMGQEGSMDSEESDASIPGLQQTFSPRAASASPSQDSQTGGSGGSAMPWPGEDIGALGQLRQGPLIQRWQKQ